MKQSILNFSRSNPYLFLGMAVLLWLGLYQLLLPFSEALVSMFSLEPHSHLGGALQFFFYDTPKVLMLLTGIVFA